MTLVMLAVRDFCTNAPTTSPAVLVGTQAAPVSRVDWAFVIDQTPQYVVIIHTTVVDWATVGVIQNTTTQIVQQRVRLSLAVHI